ncbi:MAG TPA: hypothetical protein VIG47_04325 [Gemmatimonadaceae bacterium]
MTDLPTPGSAYNQRDEAGMRHVLSLELSRQALALNALRDADIVIAAFASSVDFTIAAPRVGGVLMLDISNTSAGVIVVTLDPVFLGTFPAPAAGKRRTQMYWYDRGALHWAPVGAQSLDF